MTGSLLLKSISGQEELIRKSTGKKLRHFLTAASFACALILTLEVVCGFFNSALLSFYGKLFAFAGEAESAEIADNLTSMTEYLFYIGVPFVILYFVCRAMNSLCGVKRFDVKHTAPRMPGLYIVGCLGAGYIVSLVCVAIFGDLFEKLSGSVETPVTVPGIILYFIFVAVMPAIMEEWAFRGIIQKNLIPFGRKGAIIVSSLLFGFVHFNPRQIVFATAVGFALAICYDHTRSIKFTMLIHFTNNFISSLISYVPDNSVAAILTNMVFYAVMGVSVFAIAYYAKNGLNKKRVSFIKPPHKGCTVRTGNYLLKFVTSPGTLTLIAVYAFIMYLIYR